MDEKEIREKREATNKIIKYRSLDYIKNLLENAFNDLDYNPDYIYFTVKHSYDDDSPTTTYSLKEIETKFITKSYTMEIDHEIESDIVDDTIYFSNSDSENNVKHTIKNINDENIDFMTHLQFDIKFNKILKLFKKMNVKNELKEFNVLHNVGFDIEDESIFIKHLEGIYDYIHKISIDNYNEIKEKSDFKMEFLISQYIYN